MQNAVEKSVTMSEAVQVLVVNESFAFLDVGATTFTFHGVLRSDFTKGCDKTLHASVYDAKPSRMAPTTN